MYNIGAMFLTILHHYFIWHYARACKEWFHVWGNLLWFVAHFFSLSQMARSWLSPWKRMTEPRKKAWDIEEWLSAFFINVLSRLIGAVMRTVIIIVGLTTLGVLLVGGVFITLSWIVAPAAVFFLILLGVTYVV
jgi:hypothetical protein